MSTADEILMRVAAALPVVDRLFGRLDSAVVEINRGILLTLTGRKVHARRARKLRRRRKLVYSVGRTATGKVTYVWSGQA